MRLRWNRNSENCQSKEGGEFTFQFRTSNRPACFFNPRGSVLPRGPAGDNCAGMRHYIIPQPFIPLDAQPQLRRCRRNRHPSGFCKTVGRARSLTHLRSRWDSACSKAQRIEVRKTVGREFESPQAYQTRNCGITCDISRLLVTGLWWCVPLVFRPVSRECPFKLRHSRAPRRNPKLGSTGEHLLVARL
jgi:hypothetical protein